MSAEHSFPAGGLPEAFQPVPAAVDPTDQVYSLTGYEQLVIFRNPNSRRANEGLEPLHKLQAAGASYGLEIATHDTSPHSAENIAALQTHVTPGSLIVVRAGDGGLSAMLGAVRAAKLENSVLVLPGGNKNDIATSLNIAALLKDPDDALLRAHPQAVKPIEVSFGPEDGELTVMDSYDNTSAGRISSHIAAAVNDPRYRNSAFLRVPGGRYLLERLVTARTFAGARPLDVEHPDGVVRPTLDIIAANASRMAGSLRPRADLLEQNFRLITVQRRLGALAVAGGMMLGAPVGETVEADERRSFVLDIPEDQPASIQVDGEEHSLPVGRVTVNFALANTGVNLLVPAPKDRFITAA